MRFLLVAMLCAGQAGLPPPAEEEGVASYYSAALIGKKTASGELYDAEAETCAHRTAPFGTWLRVTVVDTGLSATCRVNDRGMRRNGRIVDVSKRVARALNLLQRGTARVRVMPMIPDGGPPPQ